MAGSNADTGFRTCSVWVWEQEVEGIGKSLEFLSLDDWKKQSPEGADLGRRGSCPFRWAGLPRDDCPCEAAVAASPVTPLCWMFLLL